MELRINRVRINRARPVIKENNTKKPDLRIVHFVSKLKRIGWLLTIDVQINDISFA